MPGVDGTLSARMIRFLEKEQAQTKRYAASASSHGSTVISSKNKQRVPILAIGNFLEEDKRFDYLQAGFVPPSYFGLQNNTDCPQIRWMAP